jgi:hypothetical protein
VLDIGCAHSGLLDERLSTGTVLHARLAGVTSGLLGVDIDAASVDKLRAGGSNSLLVADISENVGPVLAELEKSLGGCDIVLCGELLEHLTSPGMLLKGCHRIAAQYGATLLVTVPNAFCIRRVMYHCKGVELVHPDHKYYFSWKTIETLLIQSDFEPTDRLFYSDEVATPQRYFGRGRLKEFLWHHLTGVVLRKMPQLALGVIVKARPKDDRQVKLQIGAGTK